MARPTLFRWTGEAFDPANRHHAGLASAEYEAGQVVELAPVERRSSASHNHHFAYIAEAWASLPEDCAHQPWAASPEHLRKYALIRTGFCDVETVLAGSNAAALRFASMLRGIDEYALVTVEGQTVTRLTAQSQSQRAMGRARFQESKTAILDFIGDLIGVEPQALAKQKGAA